MVFMQNPPQNESINSRILGNAKIRSKTCAIAIILMQDRVKVGGDSLALNRLGFGPCLKMSVNVRLGGFILTEMATNSPFFECKAGIFRFEDN
jgi:hypothetical protein